MAALETSYKVLSGWYMIPFRITKHMPTYTNFYCKDRGTYLHIWWTSHIIISSWSAIFNILSTLIGKTLNPDPSVALHNQRPPNITNAQFQLLIQVRTVMCMMYYVQVEHANLHTQTLVLYIMCMPKNL